MDPHQRRLAKEVAYPLYVLYVLVRCDEAFSACHVLIVNRSLVLDS